MAFPATLLTDQLDAKNSEYDQDRLERYWALYAGGAEFRARIDEFIIPREIERSPNPDAKDVGVRSYEERKKYAAYVNRLGGHIDAETAEITERGVWFVVTGGTDEQQEYYEGLNSNADGRGTPLSALVRKLLRDEMVSPDTWLNIRADSNDSKMVYLSRVNPVKVIDWQQDPGSLDLTYAKTKILREYRAEPWQVSNLQLAEWVLFTPTEVAVYVAYYDPEKDIYTDADGEKVETASLDAARSGPTTLGIQLRKVSATKAQWVVDRVEGTVVLLFNKELDQSFHLAEAAYQQLVFELEDPNNVGAVIKSEINAIVLSQGDKVSYLSPDKSSFEPLAANIETLKTAIHETVFSKARDAASIPQAGRMSGETVRELRSPDEARHMSFAWPVYETLLAALESIKDFRNESELQVDIVGLIPQDVLDALNGEHTEIVDDGEIEGEEPTPGSTPPNSDSSGEPGGDGEPDGSD